MSDDLLKLAALADRVEAASGADRDLDGAIAAALGLPNGPDSGWCNNHNGDMWEIDECAARYTASIDAAMSLVPEGHHVVLERWSDNRGRCEINWAGHTVHAWAKTSALAVTAAALRARSAA